MVGEGGGRGTAERQRKGEEKVPEEQGRLSGRIPIQYIVGNVSFSTNESGWLNHWAFFHEIDPFNFFTFSFSQGYEKCGMYEKQ